MIRLPHMLTHAPGAAILIAEFSQLEDLQRLLSTCTRIRQGDVPHRNMLKACLKFDCVRDELRLRFWLYCTGAASHQLRDTLARVKFDLFELSRLHHGLSVGGEHPVGVVGEIFRDVDRTYPWHPMFTRSALGQAVMLDALRAYASTNIDVGYCQGMNYIAGFIITVCNWDWLPQYPCLRPDSAATCYLMLHSLSKSYGMRDVWKPGVVRIRLMAYQLQHYVKKLFPVLHTHFKEHDITYEMLSVQWFLPLLTSSLPFHSAKRVFQLFLVEGWKVMFRVVLAVLRRFSSQLKHSGASRLNFQSFVREWRLSAAYDPAYSVTTPGDVEGTVNVTMTSVEDASAVSVHTDERHPLYLIHHPNQLIHATLAEKSVSNRRLAALEKEFALLALSHRLESLKPAKATVKSLQVDTFTDSQLPILAPQALSPAFIDTFYVPKSHRKARRARAAPTLLPPPPAVPIPVAHPSPAPPPVEHVGMFSALRAIVSAVTGIGAVPDPAPAPAPVPHKPHPSTVKPLRMSLQRRCEVGVPITTPTPTPRPAFPSFGESEGLGMESGYASSAVKNASITTSVVGKTIASEDVEPVMSEHIKELQAALDSMAEPAKEDFAVLSSRIEQLSRSLPHLRSRVQATQQVLDVASGVLHRVQSVKQRLLDQHHHATLKIPIATRTTNRRRSSVSSSDTKSEVCTPVDSPHSQASSLHFDSASTRFDSLEEAIDADSIPVALTSKESVERLSRLSDLLREQEPRVSAATADWRKAHWEFTEAQTELEEAEQHKQALTSQLSSLIQQSESRKEARMVEVWKTLASAISK